MLPSGGLIDRKLGAANQSIELRPVAGIGRENWIAIEIPLPRNAGMRVGVTEAYTKRYAIVKRRAEIRSFQRIGISVVDALAVGIELVAEQVVIEYPARPGKRSVSAGGSEVSAIGAEAQFRSRS